MARRDLAREDRGTRGFIGNIRMSKQSQGLLFGIALLHFVKSSRRRNALRFLRAKTDCWAQTRVRISRTGSRRKAPRSAGAARGDARRDRARGRGLSRPSEQARTRNAAPGAIRAALHAGFSRARHWLGSQPIRSSFEARGCETVSPEIPRCDARHRSSLTAEQSGKTAERKPGNVSI